MILPTKNTIESTSQFNQNPLKPSGIDITFKNVTYSVQTSPKNQSIVLSCMQKTTTKTLLYNVSGIFKAGEISAIMGASGAGKTTLLNILACRVPLKNQEGQIFANDMYYDYKSFGNFANYVTQHDVFMETMTVRETLRFASDLKLNVSDDEKEETIIQLANTLKLENCLDTLVGGDLIKGISGGQKKRTSIAFELISDPQVIMLDEPTSGLDSLTSYVVVKYLSGLAKNKNKTVIMVIHQPNSEIFDQFDKLYLMVEGRIIYQGSPLTATDYFYRHFSLICPQFHNPADFLMSIIHQQYIENVERYPKYYLTYQNYFRMAVEVEILNCCKEKIQKRTVYAKWSTTFCTLVSRDLINILRNPMLIKSRLFQTITMTIYVGGLFCKFKSDYTDTLNWHALTGFFFFLVVNSIFIALTPVILIFPLQRNVVLKEESAKLYGMTAYFFSRNTVELPYALVFPMIQSLIVYWFVGLSSTAKQFFIFYLVILLLNFCGMSIGLLLGSCIKDTKQVEVISPICVLPFVLFSGYFKNSSNMEPWISWIQYISPIKYGFSALVQNEVMNRASYVSQLNFDFGLWGSIGLLIALGVGFRLLSWFFLWKLRKNIE